MSNNTIVEIAKKVCPCVVSIVATKDLPKIEGFYAMPVDDKNFVIPKFNKKERKQVQLGGGSGFIVNNKGVVLTNSHVVEDVNAEYTAVFNDDTKKPLEILARDPIHDIAICNIQGTDYPALALGDSSTIQLGESVLAVGNALGEFSNTVSLGIVSGLSRYIQAQGSKRKTEHLRGLIQTDAAINPGNSGGPLINMQGEVIGINTAVISDAQSIGFSIPINQAKGDIEQVKEYGRIRIPFLGIQYFIISQDTAQKNNLPVDYGALITRKALGEVAITPGSSAEKAGLQEFDIILEADNKKITQEFTLQDVLQEHTIGDKIPLKILREKKEKSLSIVLEEKKH